MKHNFEEFDAVTQEVFEKELVKSIKAESIESLIWKTEGLEIQPFYFSDEASYLAYEIPRNNSNNNAWWIVENIQVSDVIKANQEALEALNKGATALNFHINEVISENSFHQLIKSISLPHIVTSFSGIKKPLEFLANFKSTLNQNIAINGSISFDSYSLDEKLNKELMGFSVEQSSLFRVFVISSEKSTLTGQIADLLKQGNQLLHLLVNAGYSIDDIASRIQFNIKIGKSFLLEVAKIRALRILWSAVVHNYKPQHACSKIVFIQAVIEKQADLLVENSFIQNTTRVMSAVIGGVDAVMFSPELNSFERRINRNIQLLCRDESYFDKVIDPAAGSNYIENVTRLCCDKSWGIFQNEFKL